MCNVCKNLPCKPTCPHALDPPVYEKECLRCHCQFRFNINEAHYGDLIYDNCMYVRCPWCGHEIKEYF